jgi:hypothetical protein
MAYIIAAAVAAMMILGELYYVRRYWWTVPATGAWTARLAIDAAAALIVTAGLRHVPSKDLTIGPVVLGIVAGLGAPRLIFRMPFPTPAHNYNPFGLGYERLVAPIDQTIDEHSAEAQRIYVRDVLRPYVQAGHLRLAEVEAAFRQHIQGRHGWSEVEQAKRLVFIDDIVNDGASSEVDKVLTLVFRAWQIGAYAALQHLLEPLPRRGYGTRRTLEKIRARIGRHRE